MIKDRLITIFLVLIIILIVGIIGFFGFKIVVQGYSFNEVIEYIKGNQDQNEETSDAADSTSQVNEVSNETNIASNEVTNGTGEYVLNENRAIDLSALKNYEGTNINYDITKELMELVINEYDQDIADIASDGDILAIEFSKITPEDKTEEYVNVIRSYMAEIEAEQNRGTYNVSFSIGKNGNEILTIDKNAMLQVN